MSNLLNEKCALAKLRAELEGRKGKLCRCCKKFGYLARNCRNKGRKEKGIVIPQNKFEILKSRVMQCGVEGKTIRSMRIVEVKCLLWTNSATRCRVMGVGMARSRGRRHVFEMPKMWQRRMLCGRRSGTRGSSLLEKREDELVWMQRKREAERR